MAARQFATEVDGVIKEADAALEDVAAAYRLRCSTQDKLRLMAISEQQVLHYASKMTNMMSKAVEVAHETCEYTKGGSVPTRRYVKDLLAKREPARCTVDIYGNVSSPLHSLPP